MFVQRTLLVLAATFAVLWPASSSAAGNETTSTLITWPARGYLGLIPGRSRAELSCGMPGFACDSNVAQLYGGYLLNRNFALELGYLQLGRFDSGVTSSRVQGVALSVVGRTRIGESFGLSGRVGTTYGHSDTSVMGAASSASDAGFGVSYGAGLSWSFSRSGQATLGYDSRELRLAAGRETVRSANLGLQWRY